jgi:hypothetical protein
MVGQLAVVAVASAGETRREAVRALAPVPREVGSVFE